jgi:three-Cys-motif partner protein
MAFADLGPLMTKLAFGGAWTERKLSVVRQYLELYAAALKNQPFRRLYIDAFAGPGDRRQKRLESLPLLDLPELDAVTKGSAKLALEVEPPFHQYIFVELARQYASELSALKQQYPSRSIEVINDDANSVIAKLCASTDWRETRGVAFLDPKGMQVAWGTLVAISSTKALDAWILFPTGMGLNRLLTRDGDIPDDWQESLDRFLGTGDWRSEFYRVDQSVDLFGQAQRRQVKEANPEKFEAYILKRLGTIFPVVMSEGVRLTNSKEQVMYLLCFVSANPSPKVRALAPRLARWAAKA